MLNEFISICIVLYVSTVNAYRCNVTSYPTTIDCSELGMENLPEHLKHQIATKMIFSNNNLNSTVSFDDWPNLRYLDVSHNRLKNISSGMFRKLINLRMLNLAYNNIDAIDEDTFKIFYNLKVLDLSGNPFVTYDYLSLQRLLNGTLYSGLVKLVMRSAEIYILPEDFFKSALELQHLDLSHNNLTQIPVLPQSLIYLDLSNNFIKAISVVPFYKTPRLAVMFFENNTQLSLIDPNAFETTMNLRNVSFRGCKNLTRLPPNLFYFNKYIDYFCMADCGLVTLSRQYRHVFSKIKTVELDGNPWVCNVSIKWFIALASPEINKIRCQDPYNLTVIDVYGFNYEHNILRKVLLVLVITVFILFGLAIYFAYTKEKKKRLQMPYVPLNGKNPFHNPVYITTVV